MMELGAEVVSEIKWRLSSMIQTLRNRRLVSQTSPEIKKVFCVGLNKTGTTSWTQAMHDLGYIVGSETRATMFYKDWARGDFRRIMAYCRTDGQAFQDIPFSLPNTYEVIDREFPGSKFVLTTRDSAEQWYNSVVSFHAKHLTHSDDVPPTSSDLARTIYWQRGFLADFCSEVFKTTPEDPYNKKILLDFYTEYNKKICDYFSNRPDDFIVINVAKKDDYNRLCDFLGFDNRHGEFPLKNKTSKS